MKNVLICLILLINITEPLNAGEFYLDLEKALALAIEHDIALSSARLDIESADVTVREAYSAALPNIGLTGSVTHFMMAPSIYIPAFGERIRFTPLNDATATLSIQQPLWLGGKVGLGLEAARTYRQIARDAFRTNKARLKSDVTREYYALLLVREVVQVTIESLEQARRHSETVKRMYEVGMASEFDYLRARVEVSSLEPELAKAQQYVKLAETTLKNRLGIDADVTLELNEQLEADQSPDELINADAAYKMALQSRPEFGMIRLQERLQSIGLKVEQRSVYWPNIFLGLGYQQQGQHDEFGKLTDGGNWVEAATWTLSMQVPLFDGFATQSRTQKARIGIRRAQLDMIRLEQGVRLEVINSLSEIKRAGELVASQKTAWELAERALDIANTRFEQGMGTELEVQDAQLVRMRSRLGVLQGLYDLKVARAEYARIVENDDNLGEGNR